MVIMQSFLKYLRKHPTMYYYAPPIGYACLIFLVSSIPGRDIPSIDIPFLDKYTHFIEYAIFSFLTIRAFVFGGKFSRLTTLAIAVFFVTTLYGISDEIHQLFIDNRTAEVADVFADMFGGVLGIIAWVVVHRKCKTYQK